MDILLSPNGSNFTTLLDRVPSRPYGLALFYSVSNLVLQGTKRKGEYRILYRFIRVSPRYPSVLVRTGKLDSRGAILQCQLCPSPPLTEAKLLHSPVR